MNDENPLKGSNRARAANLAQSIRPIIKIKFETIMTQRFQLVVDLNSCHVFVVQTLEMPPSVLQRQSLIVGTSELS